MPANKSFIKNFSQFQGVDLRSSDLTRQPQFASFVDNCDLNKAGDLIKRKGFHYKEGNKGGIGLGIFEDIDSTTGVLTEKLMCLGEDLYELVDDSFNITYSGSGTALLNIKLDTASSIFKLTIVEDNVTVLEQNLGLGHDESSTTDIATVITTVNALTDFAASGGTVTTNSAAWLDLKKDSVLTSTATSIGFKRWAAVNQATTTPFSTTWGDRNDSTFEHPSMVNLKNVLYVGSGVDDLHKYDGQTFYRAGLPIGGDATGTRGDSGTAPTTAEDASGSTFSTGETYYYKFLYKQVDNKGNIVEGIVSPASTQESIAAATADIDVTVTNISASSGFNTNCAIVNGLQSGVTTITVDSGHTINSGDTLYFYDGSTSEYVTRTCTSTTSTTVVFSGSAVDVADNAVISNNLRIAIFRTVDGGAIDGTYSLVAEIPNDSIGTATQTYTDQITDANLGADFISPIKPHDLPPKGNYLAKFQNILISSGDPTNVNNVSYSDIDSPEYFPRSENSFLVDAYQGAKVQGLGALSPQLVVFKDKSVVSVTGDIGQDNFRTDEVPFGSVGCSAHHSIKQAQGALFFLSKDKGIFAFSPSSGISEVGARIEPEFTKFDQPYNFSKAVASVWVSKDKYCIFLPSESQDGSSNDYADASSRMYVYDYARDSWWVWSNVNAMGGLSFFEDTLWFSSRRLDSDSSAVETSTARFNNFGNNFDFSDHESATSFTYKSHWDALNNPSVFKKYLRLKTFNLPSSSLDGEQPLYNLKVETEFDYYTPAPLDSFTQSFGGDLLGYGLDAYGSSPYGSGSPPELKSKLKSLKCRSIRFVFSNETALQGTQISGIEVEATTPYRAHMKE